VLLLLPVPLLELEDEEEAEAEELPLLVDEEAEEPEEENCWSLSNVPVLGPSRTFVRVTCMSQQTPCQHLAQRQAWVNHELVLNHA